MENVAQRAAPSSTRRGTPAGRPGSGPPSTRGWSSWCAPTAAPSCSPTAGACASGWRRGSTSWRARRWCARITAASSRAQREEIEEMLKAGPAARPGRHQLARARHRHGGRRSGRADRVAGQRRARAAAHRPRRATRSARAAPAASSPSSAATCSRRRWSRGACSTARSSRRACRATRSTCWPSRSWPWSPASPKAAPSGRRGDRRADGRDAGGARSRRWSGAPIPFATLSRDVLLAVLDMLAGRYPSDEFADLRPRLTWDRATDRLTPRRDARLIALVSGGTIPDRGLYGVHLGPKAGRASASWTRRWCTSRASARRSCSARRPGASPRSRATG